MKLFAFLIVNVVKKHLNMGDVNKSGEKLFEKVD